jgi:hypothetical protein
LCGCHKKITVGQGEYWEAYLIGRGAAVRNHKIWRIHIYICNVNVYNQNIWHTWLQAKRTKSALDLYKYLKNSHISAKNENKYTAYYMHTYAYGIYITHPYMATLLIIRVAIYVLVIYAISIHMVYTFSHFC